MSTAFIKFLGRAVSLLLLAALGGSAYWLLQPAAWETSPSALRAASARPLQTLPEIPPAAAVLKLADQRLRAPLYDPPPPQPPPPKKEKPAPPPRVELQLIGTMIEKERSRAVLAAPNGRTEIRAEGEIVTLVPGEVTVAAVSAQQVTLRVGSANNFEITLTIAGEGNR